MKKLSLFLFVFLANIALTFASEPGGTLFIHVTIIDGNVGKPIENADILIKGSIIVAVGKNLKAAGARIIDLKGKTIMPSLISDHVHLGLICI